MEKILVLNGPLKEVIWGGDYFKKELKMTDSDTKYGELWTCSGHKVGLSYIQNGRFKGQSLDEVFNNHKELFNNSTLKDFPILVKIIATCDRLSVQVHPDDIYAKENENQYGKTEGWLILDETGNSEIVIGHNAKNKEELVKYINNDDYDNLLRKKVVTKGEFYPIPSGTIHALGANIVLLEVQQSSDVTYRFYDYHRKDALGNERPLHIQKAVDVTDYKPYNQTIINCFKDNINKIWNNEYFEVLYQEINNEFTLENNNKYCIVTAIEGIIKVENNNIVKGQSFIVTALSKSVKLKGNGKVVITYSKI